MNSRARFENNIIVQKSYSLALTVVNAYRYLCEHEREYVMSKQLLRAGTSVGANVREGVRGQSEPDLTIALKEAEETAYWLELLHDSHYLAEEQFGELYRLTDEVIRILSSITKTTYEKLNSKNSSFIIPHS